MAAPNELMPVVYDELRRLAAARLAHEPDGHTLDATALVHEAYIRLRSGSFDSRSGFYRAAAAAMQRILVDHARAKRAEKRGGTGQRFEVSEGDRVAVPDPDTVLAVNEALGGARAGRPGVGRRGPAAAFRRDDGGRSGRRPGRLPRHRLPRLGVRAGGADRRAPAGVTHFGG